MNRKKILAGNWKMNLTLSSATELATQLSNKLLNKSITTVLFPPSLFINEVSKTVETTPISLGAQNCSPFVSGAYTGEISPEMIKSCGAKYCLVGHSERRIYFQENESIINQKIKNCITSEIKPVLCVGEVLEERKASIHFEVIKKQIAGALSEINVQHLKEITIAYEPVWAIGTGLTASPEQAQEMHVFIRECIKNLYNINASQELVILYGGSCNSNNARELFTCPDVDGGLIGSASLNAEEFLKISESFPR